MSDAEQIDMRIRITEDTLRKKADYYHHCTLYGSERQRLSALQQCRQLRGELDALIDEKGRLESNA